MNSYPDGPTDKAKIDSKPLNAQLIGQNEFGSVYIHGPFGNSGSDIKIAYVIGMHPLESKSHRAFFEALMDSTNLSYCYYLYNIDVLELDEDSEGRMSGQLLAQEFIKDDIINKGYDLFIDVHSNRGSNGPGSYEITNFLFAPGFDEKSTEIIEKLLENIDELVYYAPEYRSSPSFITEPTAAAGIATIVYECYSYEPIELSYDVALKLISEVDNLEFK